MRRRDIAAGAALAALGAAMAMQASRFPRLGGIEFGPDLFPTIAAVGLILSGGAIAVEGVRAPAAIADDARIDRAAGLLATSAGFAALMPWLGFHIAAALALLAAARLFGAGWIGAASLALIAPWPLHHLFYALLRVPLPWGVLTPVAW